MPDLKQFALVFVSRLVVTVVFVGLGYLVHRGYQRVRQPGWADTPGNIKVPFGGLMVAAIIAVVIVNLAIVVTRDPLAPHN